MSKTAEQIVRDWMDDIQAKIDEYVDKYERIKRQPISCRTCTTPGCCKQRVAVPLFEAIPIAVKLRDEGRDTPQFRKRLRAEADVQAAHGQAEYFNLGRDCVFLEDGRCTIYEVRPSACRAYATFRPPADCQPPANRPMEILGMVPYVTADSFEMAKRLHELLGIPDGAERVHVDYLPRVVLRVLLSAGKKNWAQFVDRQGWPTAEGVGDMFDDDDRSAEQKADSIDWFVTHK